MVQQLSRRPIERPFNKIVFVRRIADQNITAGYMPYVSAKNSKCIKIEKSLVRESGGYMRCYVMLKIRRSQISNRGKS